MKNQSRVCTAKDLKKSNIQTSSIVLCGQNNGKFFRNMSTVAENISNLYRIKR